MLWKSKHRLLLVNLQETKDKVVADFEDEKEEEAGVALINALLNSITSISLDTFSMNV